MDIRANVYIVTFIDILSNCSPTVRDHLRL
jgi:hypothetical protein